MKYLYSTMIVSLTYLHFILKISWTPTKAIQDKTSKAMRVLAVKYNNHLHCKDNELSDVSYICLRN